LLQGEASRTLPSRKRGTQRVNCKPCLTKLRKLRLRHRGRAVSAYYPTTDFCGSASMARGINSVKEHARRFTAFGLWWTISNQILHCKACFDTVGRANKNLFAQRREGAEIWVSGIGSRKIVATKQTICDGQPPSGRRDSAPKHGRVNQFQIEVAGVWRRLAPLAGDYLNIVRICSGDSLYNAISRYQRKLPDSGGGDEKAVSRVSMPCDGNHLRCFTGNSLFDWDNLCLGCCHCLSKPSRWRFIS
jgi:hypothetical protein